MSVTSAPATNIRDPDAGLGATRRAGLASVIVLGPLSIAVLRALLPYNTTDNAATITARSPRTKAPRAPRCGSLSSRC
jgi:hypothetical protein